MSQEQITTTRPYGDVLAEHGIPKPDTEIRAINDLVTGGCARNELSIINRDCDLIAEYVIDAEDTLASIYLIYTDRYDTKHDWTVTVHHGEPVTCTEYVFAKETQSLGNVDAFITKTIDVLQNDARRHQPNNALYADIWNATTKTETATEETMQSDSQSDSKGNSCESGIESASQSFHEYRMQTTDKTHTVTTQHAVQTSESRILLVVDVLGEKRVIELPHLHKTRDTQAWEIHRSILFQSDTTSITDNNGLTEITINDYINKTIELDVTDTSNIQADKIDEELGTQNTKEKADYTCTINGINEKIRLETPDEYITRAIRSIFKLKHKSKSTEQRRPADYHGDINPGTQRSDLKRVIQSKGTPCGRLTNGDVLTELSALAVYHETNEPVRCTANVSESKTDNSQIYIEFNSTDTGRTFARKLPIPDADAETEEETKYQYTEAAVNHLGGGEVKFIDGAIAYVIPADAYSKLNSRHNATMERIGVDTHGGDWIIVTKQQYENWESKVNKLVTYEKIMNIYSQGMSDFLVDTNAKIFYASLAAANISAGGLLLSLFNMNSVNEKILFGITISLWLAMAIAYYIDKSIVPTHNPKY